MSWLRKQAEEIAQRVCDHDQSVRWCADDIERVARAYAERVMNAHLERCIANPNNSGKIAQLLAKTSAEALAAADEDDNLTPNDKRR